MKNTTCHHFIGSDGASVNSGKDSGLIKKIQEDQPYVRFLWYFTHQLESLKDAMKKYMEPVDESLHHLYYLYENYSKNNRELKSLHQTLSSLYNMEGKGYKSVKATGMRWIDHKLRAMDRLVKKFGLYTHHLENVMADTSKKKVIVLQLRANTTN